MSAESGLPCFGVNFIRNGFSFSSFSTMLATGLSYVVFLVLRYIPSISKFFREFNQEDMSNFATGFFHIY
jgi:hypothetical protein